MIHITFSMHHGFEKTRLPKITVFLLEVNGRCISKPHISKNMFLKSCIGFIAHFLSSQESPLEDLILKKDFKKINIVCFGLHLFEKRISFFFQTKLIFLPK